MSGTSRDLSSVGKYALLKRYDELGLASMSQAAASAKLDTSISQPALWRLLKKS